MYSDHWKSFPFVLGIVGGMPSETEGSEGSWDLSEITIMDAETQIEITQNCQECNSIKKVVFPDRVARDNGVNDMFARLTPEPLVHICVALGRATGHI